MVRAISLILLFTSLTSSFLFVFVFFLDGDASLIFSKGNSIQRMSLPPRPNNIGVIYQKAGAVHVGVDYDCVDQTVYWTEVTKGVIVRAKYDGSDMEVVVNSGKITSPEGERKQADGFFVGLVYSLVIIKLLTEAKRQITIGPAFFKNRAE